MTAEALALLWWLPIGIVLVWGGIAIILEYLDWKSRDRWTLPSDRLVIRPPAYRDMRK